MYSISTFLLSLVRYFVEQWSDKICSGHGEKKKETRRVPLKLHIFSLERFQLFSQSDKNAFCSARNTTSTCISR